MPTGGRNGDPGDGSEAVTPTGLQPVNCDLCGENLGYQGADVPILREEWQHKRCPQRLAEQWGISRDDVEALSQIAALGVALSFPDFPNNRLDSDNEVRTMRSRIAGETVLEMLAGNGFQVRRG